MEKLTNIIEAILFASGDAVPIDFLREKLDINKRQMDESIRQLEKNIQAIAVYVYCILIINYNLRPTPIIKSPCPWY